MSKPDEITLWAAVDKNLANHEKWVFSLEPTWDEAMKTYTPDHDDPSYKEIMDDDDEYACFFDGLKPGYKRPVTLAVKLGKAVKG